MNGLRRSSRLLALTGVGLAGSLLVAFAGPRAVGDRTISWWYEPGFPGGRGGSLAVVYIGMALLCLAWLGLGRLVATRDWRSTSGRRGGARAPTTRDLLIIGAVWILPLALGPALFSRDVYSYLAQGTIVHIGLNPYHDPPVALAQHGGVQVLGAVSPFWQHTTAPYGPLFLALVSLIVAVTGSNLIIGVLAIRALELAGLVLLAIYVPRLARALGTDPARAVWLALLSPLVMLELVAAGHNDMLMIGLLAAGVAIALEGRPLPGIALCAVAATIKVPALAAAVFIAFAWARAEPSPRDGARFLLLSAAIVAGVLAAVSILSGLGVSWLSSSVFSAPARVRLAITPATGIGWTVASLMHDLGVSVGSRGLESAFGVVAAILTAVAALVLLYRTRVSTLVVLLGTFLVVAAAGGPATWPWYFTWGLVLLAALPGPQRSVGLAVALALSVFIVKPGGILALPLQTAPIVLIVYALIAVAAWHAHRRDRDGDSGAAGQSSRSLAESAPSALART
jgi:alpha-1,6-mannosyltransferase